ncbi:hypothetical protein [Vulcanisaeta sp. JCM 16159]|uniref:hypothetical protein n=1 Tax=Vulcanisaeta sp. JCM 16159 TaxID=1295371 RepID=UPI0006D0A4B8|nr:hypothetical protein [Vulcanisaeta sp. JCM 16159]
MWFYITGQRIQEGSQELVGGDLYQCPTRSISSGDFEELRSWIRRVCEEIGWVQARNPSSIEYLVSRPGARRGSIK